MAKKIEHYLIIIEETYDEPPKPKQTIPVEVAACMLGISEDEVRELLKNRTLSGKQGRISYRSVHELAVQKRKIQAALPAPEC